MVQPRNRRSAARFRNRRPWRSFVVRGEWRGYRESPAREYGGFPLPVDNVATMHAANTHSRDFIPDDSPAYRSHEVSPETPIQRVGCLGCSFNNSAVSEAPISRVVLESRSSGGALQRQRLEGSRPSREPMGFVYGGASRDDLQLSTMQRAEDAKFRLPRSIQDLQHMRNTIICFCNSLEATPYFASLGNKSLYGSMPRRAVISLSHFRFAMFFPPTQRVPVWTRRWGDIPQPSDECAWRAVLPYMEPSHT